MTFWNQQSTRAQQLERLQQELHEIRERSELLDTTCGVGLWQAVLVNADALDPRSAWTWSPEFRRLLGYSSEAEFPNVCPNLFMSLGGGHPLKIRIFATPAP